MSTKIYEAYRIPLDKIPEFMEYVRETMYPLVLDHVEELMPGVEDHAIEDHAFNVDDETVEEMTDRREERIRLVIVGDIVEKASNKKTRCPPFDIDCGVRLYFDNEFAYAIPFGENYVRPNDWDFPEWVKDFSYWNNTDKPEDISREAWNWRGDKWREISGDSALFHVFDGTSTFKGPASLHHDIFKRREDNE